MKARKLNEDFYLQSCLKAAKEMIGKVLVRKKGRKIYSGIIVETEAYLGDRDAASHSFIGRTKRNEHMFGTGGTAYVYFTYGNHYCVNAVISKPGVAHAVLIRAIEPLKGIKAMMKNRCTDNIYELCSGPGKLTQAMEIGGELNGASLLGDEIYITMPEVEKKHKIIRTKRIGITKNAEVLFRFIDSESPFVSRVNYRRILDAQQEKNSKSNYRK